jgi:S-adenosylmethionine:tRNA ribosyltransferase-isomerase
VHRRQDYDFELPPAQIAQTPAARRDGSRLLVVGADGSLADRQFPDVVELIPADAVVVVNDTRVIPARVHAVKETGGHVELLFVEPAAAPGTWRCLARARRPLRAGQRLHLCRPDRPDVPAAGAPVLVVAEERAGADGSIAVTVPEDAGTVHAFLDTWGALPLPPYIARDAGLSPDDRERYQTVYAAAPGAIAAPTAGLHLTPALLDAIRARGAAVASVTLHVGLGTFAPVRVDDLADHVMHVERYTIPDVTAALVATGRPVVAVGTTVVRALEAAARGDRDVAPGPGQTALFIRPGTGFAFRVVDHLITNFHLPESTLLMLVSTFAGVERVRAAYRHAVAAGYRFFSYGDASFLTRATP